MKNLFQNWNTHIERFFPWIILGILAIFTYGKFVVVPYMGFGFLDGRITEVFTPTADEAIQAGDLVISVDQILVAETLENKHLPIFADAQKGDIVSLVLDRDGTIVHTEWVIPGPDRTQVLQRFNSQWWLPYVFWIAGLATLLFIRPKNTQWKLLVAFNFLTAIWLAVGSLTQWRVMGSAIIMRSFIWLCLPVYLHFHWEFPSKLKRLPKFFLWLLYSFGLALAISEGFQIPTSGAYTFGFAVAIIGSVILLVAHVIFQKEYRSDLVFLGLAVVVILLPSLGFVLISFSPAFSGGALLSFPALPGAYFFVAYRRQFRGFDQRFKRLTRLFLAIVFGGTAMIILLSLADFRGNLSESTLGIGIIVTLIAALSAITGFSPFLALPALTGETISLRPRTGEIEIRANRLLSLYLFAVFVGLLLSIGIIITDSLLDFPGKIAIIGIGAALLASMITAAGFASFQRFIDKRILGIQLPPEELLNSYADRITTSLDQKSLVQLLREELLPSLLVRQSALLLFDAGGGIKQFTTLGVMEFQIPNETDIPVLLSQAGRNLASTLDFPDSYAWIRLILPLQVSSKMIGLWLFGRRDPDDFYTQPEVSLLETLANQTAIALVNIEQADRLHTLYKANIEWHEEERTALARELHDNVLGQMAVLSTQSTSIDSPEFQETYQQVTSRLRGMVTNLRPAMLQYGLSFALEECVDELSTRLEDGYSITLEVPRSDARYDPKVEEHLYRIVQQACENAIRHARTNQIRVYGNLDPSHVNLTIEDDGVGFDMDKLDFNSLLIEKHFGLAGMFERADLISADLRIISTAGEGARVHITWQKE